MSAAIAIGDGEVDELLQSNFSIHLFYPKVPNHFVIADLDRIFFAILNERAYATETVIPMRRSNGNINKS